MGVRLQIDNEYWFYLMKMFGNKQKFVDEVEDILLESGKMLNTALKESIENSPRISPEAQQKFIDSLSVKTSYKSDSRVSVDAGFLFEKYDSKNPATGVKALWLNYGNKELRHTSDGGNRGMIWPSNFVKRARDKVAKSVHEMQVKRVDRYLQGTGFNPKNEGAIK
jgi:hypothetical protein